MVAGLEAGPLEIRADIGWPLLSGLTLLALCAAPDADCQLAGIASSGRVRFALPRESAPYLEVGVFAARFQGSGSERWTVSPLLGAGWRGRFSNAPSAGIGLAVAKHLEPLGPGDEDLSHFFPVLEISIGFAL